MAIYPVLLFTKRPLDQAEIRRVLQPYFSPDGEPELLDDFFEYPILHLSENGQTTDDAPVGEVNWAISLFVNASKYFSDLKDVNFMTHDGDTTNLHFQKRYKLFNEVERIADHSDTLRQIIEGNASFSHVHALRFRHSPAD